uniref:C2H2-type domain-containing protein n=1 Tax=Gouania willdenowi TaxID=441366 RepID=A0A8C5DDT4_GOUWI
SLSRSYGSDLAHAKVHTVEQVHVCGVCLEAFSSAGRLRTHLRRHLPPKQHVCSFCSKSFRKPCLLRTHLLTHVKASLRGAPPPPLQQQATPTPTVGLSVS